MLKSLLFTFILLIGRMVSAATPSPTSTITPSSTPSATISTTMTTPSATQTSTISPTNTVTPTLTQTPYRSASQHSNGKTLVVPIQLAVTNTAGTTTTSINYWFSMPSWISLDPASVSANVTQRGNILSINIPTLAAGGNTLVTYSLDVALGPFDMGVQQSINGAIQNSDKNLTQSTTPKWAQATIP